MHEHGNDPGGDQAAEASAVSRSAMEVWRVDLGEVEAEPLRLLSAAEHERAARIADPARRALWMRGRGVLRVLLGGYLGRAGDELELITGRYGKPGLAPAGMPQGLELHFNLSHSGPMALYAFTAGASVGGDLGLVRG